MSQKIIILNISMSLRCTLYMYNTHQIKEDIYLKIVEQFLIKKKKIYNFSTYLIRCYFVQEQFDYLLEYQVPFDEVFSECHILERKLASQANYTRFEGDVPHVVHYETLNVSGTDVASKNLRWVVCDVRGVRYCYQSYCCYDLMRCRSYFFYLEDKREQLYNMEIALKYRMPTTDTKRQHRWQRLLVILKRKGRH